MKTVALQFIERRLVGARMEIKTRVVVEWVLQVAYKETLSPTIPLSLQPFR